MKSNWLPIIVGVVIIVAIINKIITAHQQNNEAEKAFAAFVASEPIDTVWRGWNKYEIPTYNDSGKLIWYGHELIANTAYYLGPKGTVAQISNGMNCQNCHLDGGTIPYGNNYGKVYAVYPQFRARNNGIQTIYDRVTDCFERSLNGKAPDSTSKEMKAIYAYIKWLGNGTPKGYAKGGTSLMKLKYLEVAASPEEGNKVYASKCQSCHGEKGAGKINAQKTGYDYPPLWGVNSYNDGAGLYRLGSFASFVKNNMPFGTDYHKPALSDEEAWNVAAFVNSQPRPQKDKKNDWKDISKKPVDHPFGPYTDTFSEKQHKFGPFIPINNFQKKLKQKL